MEIEILKCHGSGNDFILIDKMDYRYDLNDEDKKNLALTLCNRNSGIGADGLLMMEDCETADCTMRIFNADGTEADMCANGLRLAGRYISEKKKASHVGIENITQINYSIANEKEIFEKVIGIEVSMPPANFYSADVPVISDNDEMILERINELDHELSFTAVAMPNPHIISFVNTIDENKLISIGKKANELKSVFPKGVNVSFVKIISLTMIYVATYERGVGITNSCGTAMFASVASAIKNNLLRVDEEIKVINKGGFIKVIVNEDWGGTMYGNATYNFRSTIEWHRKLPFRYKETERKMVKNEDDAYILMQASVLEYIEASNV